MRVRTYKAVFKGNQVNKVHRYSMRANIQHILNIDLHQVIIERYESNLHLKSIYLIIELKMFSSNLSNRFLSQKIDSLTLKHGHKSSKIQVEGWSTSSLTFVGH